jgi:tartrate dehydrogenase/decarboxylase/D-malate dehydrogenase
LSPLTLSFCTLAFAFDLLRCYNCLHNNAQINTVHEGTIMNRHRIALLPGDGIGKEIMPEALAVLNAAAEKGGFELTVDQFPWGCEHFLETGEIMPENGVDILSNYDAIYFVAAGHPDVTDYLSAWEFIFIMRKQFAQYINLRPIKAYDGVPTLLANQDHEIDMIIVRENSEGEYAGPGGTVHGGHSNELSIQTNVFTREGVERAMRYGFELARKRRGRVTNVTKSNALLHGMVFWDKIAAEVSQDYPDVEYETLYVDAATMKFLINPGWFDVIVTTNMFGDILSDLGGAMIGSIGLAPSSNVNPERKYPSMFEPVHGSAPDIAGLGYANPVATILAGAMMLEHLGEIGAAERVRVAVEATLASGVKTRDLGGEVGTRDMAARIVENL